MQRHLAERIEHFLAANELVAAGRMYRFAELELYHWSESHPDPFSHRHPLQRECGRWYLHRTGRGYRSGSFKGLDFTLGDGQNFSAVLLRTLTDETGRRIEGPSKIVDHLLRELGLGGPANLDRHLGDASIWSANSPLHIRERVRGDPLTIHQVPRVGLSLKRLALNPQMPRFLAKPYRFLVDPSRMRKGRPSLALGLHCQGRTSEEIAEITGLPQRTITRYVAWYTEGLGIAVPSFGGRELDVCDQCRLLGALESFNLSITQQPG